MHVSLLRMAQSSNLQTLDTEAKSWSEFSTKKPAKTYELQLVQKKQLFFQRSNHKFVIFKAPLSIESSNNTDTDNEEKKQEEKTKGNTSDNDRSLNNDRLWYRHMTQEQFNYLLTNNRISMVDKKAYVAITTCHSYCFKYLNGEKRNGHTNTHIVQFIILDKNIDLNQIFKLLGKEKLGIKNMQPKIEDGAFTWGLGPQCRKGILGVMFNQLLKENKIKWRLVNFKLPINKSPIVNKTKKKPRK